LQGADDLEVALVHLVVLVLPRPVMAAVDRGRGACQREGAASSAAWSGGADAHMAVCAAWRGARVAGLTLSGQLQLYILPIVAHKLANGAHLLA